MSSSRRREGDLIRGGHTLALVLIVGLAASNGVSGRGGEVGVSAEGKAGNVQLVLSFAIDEDLWATTDWTEPPQFALWLENESTGVVRTLFVTRRTAKDDWEGQSSVPAALPYWVTRYQKESGRERGPTFRDPLPDAVTGATPKQSFSHPFKVEEGDWSLYLEVNVSGDYNNYYERVFIDGGLEDFGNGQPSLVYRTRDITANGGSVGMEIIGQTAPAETPEEMLVEPHHITSAHRLLQEITLATMPGGE